MSPERLSGLKLYSLGIVVKDKAVGSDQIIVYPVEELPTVYGAISKMQQNKASLPDAQGAVKSSQAESQNTLTATWIPYGQSNRMTSPDVVEHETVLIFRYMDTSEYYWTTVFREPSLRRTETVVYAFGNIPKGMTAFDSTTSYWFKVDTKNKLVQLHTANNDGESCGYDAILDTKNGTFTLEDTLGNNIILDSTEGLLTANINKKVVINTIDVEINAKNSFVVNTNVSTINAQNTSTINTATSTINASSETGINTPTTNISANTNIGGNLDVAENILGGNGTFTAIGGNVNAAGTVTSAEFNGPLNGNAKTATYANTAG